MGARGRMPQGLRIAGGTDVPVPAGSVAAVTPTEKPDRPKWADEDQELGDLWEETVDNLDKAGLLSAADAQTIEATCRHMILLRMAYREVKEAGVTTMTADNPEEGRKKHPAEVIMRLQSQALLELLKQSGMTWMSRARTTAAPSAGEAPGANPFGEVVGQ